MLLTQPRNGTFHSWKTGLSAEAVEELVFAQAHEMDPEKRLSLERIRMA